MSEQVNYMQRVGHSRCVRCDFETSDDMTFEQQDAAMMAHLADKHPDWMGIGRAEPSPEPEAAPEGKGDAERIVARIRSKIEMEGATPEDWVWEALAVLEADGKLKPQQPASEAQP